MPPRRRAPGRGRARRAPPGGGNGGNAGDGNNQGGGANAQPQQPQRPVYTVDASMVVQPISDSSPVAIEAQHALVQRTSFLPWENFPVVGQAPARRA